MRRSLISRPLTITISQATLAASLMTASTLPTDAQYEYVGLDATQTVQGAAEMGMSVVEAIGADLPDGQSFTDAQAATLAVRLGKHTSHLPISEVDLGSD